MFDSGRFIFILYGLMDGCIVKMKQMNDLFLCCL